MKNGKILQIRWRQCKPTIAQTHEINQNQSNHFLNTNKWPHPNTRLSKPKSKPNPTKKKKKKKNPKSKPPFFNNPKKTFPLTKASIFDKNRTKNRKLQHIPYCRFLSAILNVHIALIIQKYLETLPKPPLSTFRDLINYNPKIDIHPLFYFLCL